MAEQPSQRNGIYIALVLVAGAAAIVWTMVGLGPSQAPLEEDPLESAEAPEPTPAAAPAAEEEPTPRARPRPQVEDDDAIDLFAGEQPDFMADAHARVLEGKWLNVAIQKQLYNWGQEHKDDARPQLLLAWDSVARDWDGMAVRVYRMAYEADQRAKHDPRMLEDLLEIAVNHGKMEHRESRDLIVQAYGEEALPDLDAKLAELRERRETQKVERLQAVRDAITGG